MKFELPPLPYSYDALAPIMSAETLEYHHDKHHQAYVNKANSLVENTDYVNLSLEEVIKKSYHDNKNLFNNAAQHYNHIHFWKWMRNPSENKLQLPENFEKAIKESFGSVDKLKEDFFNAATTQFGSGWAYIIKKDGKLSVVKMPNGENPLILDAKPLLGIDVWEHSYYLDYRNDRAKYVKAFWDNLVNWEYVFELYEAA